MDVNVNSLIRNLENIKDKLEENGLLDEIDDLTISIIIAHLEDLKD